MFSTFMKILQLQQQFIKCQTAYNKRQFTLWGCTQSDNFRQNIKIVLLEAILWMGRKAFMPAAQVCIMRIGPLGLFKEATSVPCPKPFRCYRQSLEHLQCKN
jgi:hypothetical protein